MLVLIPFNLANAHHVKAKGFGGHGKKFLEARFVTAYKIKLFLYFSSDYLYFFYEQKQHLYFICHSIQTTYYVL